MYWGIGAGQLCIYTIKILKNVLVFQNNVYSDILYGEKRYS
jgi:hypothetical protein